jgi:protein N-terminal amidase
MAWNTREEASSFHRSPGEPCLDTLSYWLARLKPLLTAEEPTEVIVVLANRTGVEGDMVYAGTSTIIGIESGGVKFYGALGRGEKELLTIDTLKPRGKLVFVQAGGG